MAAMRVGSAGIESGQTVLASGGAASSVVETLGSSYDRTKTWLWWNYTNGGATTGPGVGGVRLVFNADNQLTFERATSDTNTVTINWWVVPFASGVATQYIALSDVDDGDTITISSVDLDKSFIVMLGYAKTGTGYNTDDGVMLSFASATSVRVDMAGAAPSDAEIADISAVVVTVDDCDVTTITGSEASYTSSSISETFSPVDSTAALVFGTMEHSIGSEGFDDIMWIHYFGLGSIVMERVGTTSGTFGYTLYAVDFTEPGVDVQHDTTTQTAGTAHTDETISAVDLDFAVIYAKSMNNGHPASAYGTDEQYYTKCFGRFAFDGTTGVDVDRGVGSGSQVTWAWSVIEFIEETGGTDVPLSATAAGSGSAAVDFDVDVPLAPTASGSGSATVALSVDVPLAAVAAGSGSAAVAFSVDVPLAVTASGSGSVAIDTLVDEEVDCYDNTNTSDAIPLGAVGTTGAAQSFDGSGGFITRVRVEVARLGSPTGNLACHIYAHSGTFGTSSVPTGSALATADNTFAAGSLSTSPTEIDFTFDGTFQLDSGTHYCVVIDGISGDIVNRVDVSTDDTSPTAPGNASAFIGSWGELSGEDMIFCVFATIPEVVNLAAVAAGSGSASVTFAVDVTLAPIASGSGSAAVAFSVDVPLSATASGSGSAAASLDVDVPLVIVASGSGSAAVVFAENVTEEVEVVIAEVETVLALDPMTEEQYMSVLNIWNIALARLGQGPVTSAPASDGSATGGLLAGNWASFKEMFLRETAWDGAKRTALLATFKHSDGTTAVEPVSPERWSFCYQLPDDHVRSLRLNGRENQIGPKAMDGLGLWEEEVAENDAGTLRRCLFARDSTAYLEYIFLVPDSNITLLPADMRWAMGKAFAAHVAPFFGKTENDMLVLERHANESVSKAKRSDDQTGAKPTYLDRSIEYFFY